MQIALLCFVGCAWHRNTKIRGEEEFGLRERLGKYDNVGGKKTVKPAQRRLLSFTELMSLS